MKKRHKKASGGAAKPMDYTNESNVPKEAMERKRGGRAKKDMKAEGCVPKGRADKRARGGRTGGSPFSAAHSTSDAKGHSTPDTAKVNKEDD